MNFQSTCQEKINLKSHTLKISLTYFFMKRFKLDFNEDKRYCFLPNGLKWEVPLLIFLDIFCKMFSNFSFQQFP